MSYFPLFSSAQVPVLQGISAEVLAALRGNRFFESQASSVEVRWDVYGSGYGSKVNQGAQVFV